MSISVKWFFFVITLVVFCGKAESQIVDRYVFSVFSPISPNDSLSVAGGQIMTGLSDNPIVEHGYYPLNHSLLSISEEEITDLNYTIYPNPFNTSFTIRLDSQIQDQVFVAIYGPDGKLIQTLVTSDKVVDIELIDQTPGIYFVKTYTSNGMLFHEKLIKN